MAAGVIQRVFGFEVHGLRTPTDTTATAPLLITTGELNSLPGAFSAYTVLPHLKSEDVSGYSWSSDPRRIIGSGGQCVVRMLDKSGLWGQQLIRNASSTSWDIQDVEVTQGQTTLRVGRGPNSPPTQDQIYWIEGEAIQVTSAPALVPGSATVYSFTISRAKCGSRAIYHRIDPLAYDAGSDGREVKLYLDSRPNIASYLFTGAVYLFRVDQFGAVVDYIKRFVYLDEPAIPQKGKRWEFRFRDIGDLLAAHQPGSKAREVGISHRLTVHDWHHSSDPGTIDLYVPNKAYAYLTRHEAELLFREPLHVADSPVLDSSKVISLSALLGYSTKISYAIEVEAAGKWLYQIINPITYIDVVRDGDILTVTPLVKVSLQLIGEVPGEGVYSEESSGYADGWAVKPASPVGKGKPGERSPKLTLRPIITAQPIEAFLYLCCSDSFRNSDTYDVIVGRIGAGLPSAWFNLGSTVANPLLADPGTKELLTRNQLLDETFYYHLSLKSERKLGDFIGADICQLHSLLFGPLTTGLLTLRPWVRVQPVSIPAMPTLSTREIEPGARLGRIRSMELQSGFDALTLTPEFTRSVRARDARLRGETDKQPESQTVRVWQPGNHIQVQDITTGALGQLVRAFLDVYGGAPIVYEVPTSQDFLLDNALDFADFVTWSNSDVLSDNGTGVSGTFILFGYNIKWGTGELTARIIKDTFNSSETTIDNGVSQLAPALIPAWVRQISGLTFQVAIDAIADPGVNLESVYDQVFIHTSDDGSWVRVTRSDHNPQNGASERDGYLEAYAQITSSYFDAGQKKTLLTITFDSAWERGSKQIARDILIPHDSILTLCDRRPDGTHPQSGTDLEPSSQQLGGKAAQTTKVAGPQSFDRYLNLFGV
jgi:hypothetical protein